MSRSGYSDDMRAQCVIWSIQGHGSTAVQTLFTQTYHRNPPARSTIRQWRDDYQTRGSHSHRGGNGRPQISQGRRARIRELFDNNPRLSLRTVASEVGVAHSTVWNILRNELNRFPYKLQRTTTLTEDHKIRRKQFAQTCRRELRDDAEYLKRIVFSDECKFTLSGQVNKQNCRIWGTERPNEVYETRTNSPSVMVWCAMSKNGIIGPYFFENENVTGTTYKRMLRYFLFPKLRDYPEDMIFQQDGAPPHFAIEVRQYLDRKLPEHWMGRGGSISWPAYSPDLTPCDYFLWGYIKDIVYRNPPRTISELKTKIGQAIRSINEDMLHRVFENMKTRLNFVIRERGGAFEHLMN